MRPKILGPLAEINFLFDWRLSSSQFLIWAKLLLILAMCCISFFQFQIRYHSKFFATGDHVKNSI